MKMKNSKKFGFSIFVKKKKNLNDQKIHIITGKNEESEKKLSSEIFLLGLF